MNEKIKGKLKQKKGSAKSIVVVFMLVVILTLTTLLIQVISCESSTGFLSQTASFTIRTLSDQGGIKTVMPEGYPGKYLTSKDLYNTLDEGFAKAGFESWELTINGQRFTPHSEINVPKRENINIHLEGDIKVVARVLNAKNKTMHFEANRSMISNFEERTGTASIVK